MAMKNITLIFAQKEVESRFPNNIEDLKKICLEKFELTNMENFSFYYEENNIETEIDENNFDSWKSDKDIIKKNKIKIKEKYNNITRSLMSDYLQTRESQFYEFKNTVIIDDTIKEDLIGQINKCDEELKGNINSEQCILSTKDYGGKGPTKTAIDLENQIDDNYNYNQNIQNNDDNIISESNTNNIIKAEKIKLKTEKNNRIDEKERISKLENENKQITKKNNELIKECNNLKKEINEYNEENSNLKKEIDELNKENNDLKDVINKLEKEKTKNKEQINIIENSKCETIHHNIECNKCNIISIKGFRYICSECNNYNICQQCYEINLDIPFHKHYFCRLKNNISNECIQQFRNEYNTPSKYKNGTIAKVLEETDGNLEDAFFKLFFSD